MFAQIAPNARAPATNLSAINLSKVDPWSANSTDPASSTNLAGSVGPPEAVP